MEAELHGQRVTWTDSHMFAPCPTFSPRVSLFSPVLLSVFSAAPLVAVSSWQPPDVGRLSFHLSYQTYLPT